MTLIDFIIDRVVAQVQCQMSFIDAWIDQNGAPAIPATPSDRAARRGGTTTSLARRTEAATTFAPATRSAPGQREAAMPPADSNQPPRCQVAPHHGHAALVSAQSSDEDALRRRFTGAARPQKAKDFTLRHGKGQILERRSSLASIGEGQSSNVDHRRHSSHSTSTIRRQ